MGKTALNGMGSKTQTIEQDFQDIILDKIPIDSTIKITSVNQNGGGETVHIPTVRMGILLESQDKIMFLTNRDNFSRRVQVVKNTDNVDIKVFRNVAFKYGTRGEIKQTDDESTVIKMENLQKPPVGAYIDDLQGETKGDSVLIYKKINYQASYDQKALPIEEFDFLVLDKNKFPQFIELYFENESIKLSQEQLLLIEEEKYGLVRKEYAINGTVTDTYGTADAILINLKGVTKCIAYDEVQANDFPLYGVII